MYVVKVGTALKGPVMVGVALKGVETKAHVGFAIEGSAAARLVEVTDVLVMGLAVVFVGLAVKGFVVIGGF
jgi:hypothetical protein